MRQSTVSMSAGIVAVAGTAPLDRCPDWRDYAACLDADPDLFFPDSEPRSAWSQVKTAKLICRSCPVSATCLSWALGSGQEAGIWGGLTEDERRRLQRRSVGVVKDGRNP
jgi:WhiB family transcriptional regulator, redox-sensing transcriptional regulator